MDVNLKLFSDRLRRLLAGEEGTLPDAAKEYIQNLQTEVDIVASLLRDFEDDSTWLMANILAEKLGSSDLLGILKEINCFVHESDRAIDICLMSMVHQKSEIGCSSEDMGDALLSLQSKIVDIGRQMQQVQHIPADNIDELKSIQTQASSFSSSSSSVFEGKMEEVLDLLIEGQLQLSVVVTVADSSGLAQSAFNTEVYNSNYVKNYFDCRALVSFNFNAPEMLDDIIKSVMPPSKLGEIMVKDYQWKKRTLRDYLRNRRFLIVLDEMWIESVWDEIKEALPDDRNGSRVFTSINLLDIAASHNIEGREKFPLDLVAGGGPQIQSFKGIDFVYLYYGSKSISEYLEDPDSSFYRLAVSISELPSHLKLCLFYFTCSPQCFEISTKQLYQLWIVEGFIPDNSETTAEEYLEELVSRGFVKATKRRSGGTIKICSILSYTKSMLMVMANAIGFVKVHAMNYEDIAGSRSLFLAAIRNLSKRLIFSAGNLDRFDLFQFSELHLHSLMHPALTTDHHLSSIFCERICKEFKYLRILNLGSLVLSECPSGIENLPLLRYLKLNIPYLKSLPSSLCNLLNLYTLEMPFNYIDHTPYEFWKMKKLRHLNVGYIKLPIDPENDCNFLENLNFIFALHPSSCTPDILGRLPKLQSLRIYGDINHYQSALSKNLCKLSYLECLKLVNQTKITQLSQLVLFEFQFPETLTHLSLLNTKLKDDPMFILEKLQHLKVLKLKENSYFGRKLACSSNGFPYLKVLHLKSMFWLEEWTVGVKAMPKLESLIIDPCAYLRRLPEELWRLRTLCKLELHWLQPELRQSIRKIEDKEHYDIHIYPNGL